MCWHGGLLAWSRRSEEGLPAKGDRLPNDDRDADLEKLAAIDELVDGQASDASNQKTNDVSHPLTPSS